jgi:signal transduction histidine kinase
MHDVLGHRLSLLSLPAGALEVSQAADAATVEATRNIRVTARQSLDHLRQIIGVLRDGSGWPDPPGGATAPAAPQPTLSELPELITATRQSGLGANITILLDSASGAPAALGTAAYRIVQEALTNVLRHAPGTTADVTVRGAPDEGLTIEVTNPVPVAAPSPAGADRSGTGLVGITERATALGGSVSAGPTDDGRFVVTAWLPWGQVS